MLYDININYYFRLNFAGFEKIIDALGGITVNSDYEFDSQNTKGYHFNKGENHLNGDSREKKEKEDWWHSGYEETKWYIESQHKRGYAIPIVHNNYWPSAHGKYYVQVDNREEKQSVWFAQNRIYLRKGQTYNFSGLFSNTIFFQCR